MQLSCSNKYIYIIFALTSIRAFFLAIKFLNQFSKMKKFILGILFIPFIINAQVLKVVDKETLQHIPFASLDIYDLAIQSKCDENGEFELNIELNNISVLVSAEGYKSNSFTYKKDQNNLYIIELERSHFLLNEVVISPTLGIVQQYNLTNVFLKTISSQHQIMNSNLMGIVSSVPGVYSINLGTGISKPVIRGMSGLKVVTFLNGLRIENQQWGNDHGVNFSDMGIKSVEIVKGPSSLLYGADALGGVLYFVDEDYVSSNTTESSVETRFESNTLSTSNIASLKIASKNIRFNIYAGFNNAADYQIPNGSYIVNSRFKGNSLKASLGFNKEKWVLNLRYNHNSNQIGLPGHTHSANPNPITFQSEFQNRDRVIPFQLIKDHYISLENKLLFDNSVLKLTTGFTSNSLTEHEEKVTIPGIKIRLTNLPYHLSLATHLNENFTWISGTQGMLTKNVNAKEALSILIPNSSSNDYGVYSLFKYSKHYIESQIGFRYDYREINSVEIGSRNFSKLNGSFGFLYHKNAYTFRTNFSSGYRPPHITEMLANGVHHGTNRYEIGSNDLDSEFANQFDVSLDYNNEHISFNVNPFFNTFKNYIYIKPTGGIINDYPVYVYSQATSARTYGGELYMHYHPHFFHRLHLEQDFSYVIAEDNNNLPLPLIPQTRINTKLKYEFRKQNTRIQLQTLVVQRTHFLAKEDVATFETSSQNYQVYNVEVNFSYNAKQTSFLKLGVRNLFNATYINHLSNLKGIGLPSPGINFYFSINHLFN